ncbi:MAG TPA: serine/threonine-protein kinase [Oculatellaceae cyanobacterium]
MAELENHEKETSLGHADAFHACPSCGISFSSAILVCPNDGAVIRQSQSIRNSLHSRYEFLSEAGAGGAGVVYKAKQKSTGKLVAIKMVSLDQVNKESQARFQAEANACSRLVHDNLIRLHDYGITESGQPYIVLEYIDGIDLSEMLKKAGGVSLRTSLEIAEQLCAGLQHAHAQEILHRDLKPGNIMVTWNAGHPVVKIVDFSIAKLDDEKTKSASVESAPKSDGPGLPSSTPSDASREIVGTPAYMSPEQIQGRELDQRSDLYSLGCVIFQMLVGQPPCQGKNPVQTVFKQLNEEAPTLAASAPGRTFPQGLEDIVAKLLKKSPGDRYRTAGDLLDDLKRVHSEIVENEAIQQAKARPEKKKRVVVKTTPVKLIVTVLLVIICIGAVIFTQQNAERARKAAQQAQNATDNSAQQSDKGLNRKQTTHKSASKKNKQ